MVVKRAPKVAFAVNTCFAENGGPSDDMRVVGLDEKVDGSFSSKVTLSKGFVSTEDENVFEEAAAHRVQDKSFGRE